MNPAKNLLFLLLLLVLIDRTISSDPNGDSNDSPEVVNGDSKDVNGESLISPSREERAKTMREYWRETLEDIKNIAVLTPPLETKERKPLTQWKLFRDDVDRPRFEGFASWERQLQQWTDEVSDYMERIQNETGEYPFSTYGRPAVARNVTEGKKSPWEFPGPMDAVIEDETTMDELETNKRKQRPVPAPAKPGEAVLPHTNIADKSKRLLIVTTAALPWMTGTAVNPLLRAAYLVNGREDAGGSVTLMLPWVERMSDQERVYGKDKTFKSEQEQEEYIRTWLRDTAGMPEASEKLKIMWYTAWQERAENSLYSMGDITALIPAEEVDICILEEPEHLNWYRAPGEHWTEKFKHVVGIIHTNYFAYAQEQPAAFIRAPGMRLLCSWMIRAHCHRVIKLSGTLGKFAPEKELVENVHGVREKFLEIGSNLKDRLMSNEGKSDPVFGPEADPSVYFIGKQLWSKGLGSLMELLKYAEESADLRVKVDMYGGGPDKDAAEAKAKKLGLDMPFHGPIDHPELGETHKIFINPSTTEVLCTTVAEALAMGKFVIVPSHPSNDFFAQFPNCLPYASKEEFVGNLYYALTHSPAPMTEEYSYALTWEAATERLEAAGCITENEALAMEELHSSEEAGIDIDLPPLIENEKRKQQIITTFRKSRARYRNFRSRLKEEVLESNVLPRELQKRLVSELDKRLDVDIDEVLENPKLRIQLSPAELDKQLLDFYTKVAKGQSGDVFRVIGGGANVGRQNLYMKQQARKKSQKGLDLFSLPAFVDLGDDMDDRERTTTQWVKLALNRRKPTYDTRFAKKQATLLRAKNKDKTKMSLATCSFCKSNYQPLNAIKTVRLGSPPAFRPSRSTTLSLLI